MTQMVSYCFTLTNWASQEADFKMKIIVRLSLLGKDPVEGEVRKTSQRSGVVRQSWQEPYSGDPPGAQRFPSKLSQLAVRRKEPLDS